MASVRRNSPASPWVRSGIGDELSRVLADRVKKLSRDVGFLGVGVVLNQRGAPVLVLEGLVEVVGVGDQCVPARPLRAGVFASLTLYI